MDFKSLVPTVSKIAPVLGAALGGPAGGIIGSLLASVFGGTSNPDDLIAKINADPEAALKLKSLEFQHEDSLAKLQSINYQNEVDDRKNARSNADKYKWFLIFLASAVTLGFFATIFLIFTQSINLDDPEKQLLSMLFGVLTGKWSTIIDFFYGSSHK